MEIFSYIIEQARYLHHKTVTVEDAEDIIQDVYELVWRKKAYFEAKPIEEQKKIITYCIRNTWYDSLRAKKMKKRTMPHTEAHPSYKPTVYSLLELKYVLKKIDDLDLECLLDTALGYTTAECIERHNRPAHRVNFHSKISRDRKLLRKHLN